MDIQKGTYLLNDLKIGDYNCLTLVSYSLEETPTIVARLTDEVLQASMPTVLALKLDHVVDQKMQEPDLDLDDMPLSSFGFPGMEDVKGRLRIWMTDALTFGTVCTTTEDGLTYLFVARKGEPREPDFRKGKWGDSMTTCKSKEGKRDNYNVEGIYAFDTYVAGDAGMVTYSGLAPGQSSSFSCMTSIIGNATWAQVDCYAYDYNDNWLVSSISG